MPDKARSLEDWLDLVLRCGKANLKAMELLDAGNTKAFGDPVPTQVSLGIARARPSSFPGMISKTCTNC